MEGLEDAAALCVTELASNAILHSRTPFTVAVQHLSGGVRIDVQDERPHRLPVPVPPDGLEPLELGTTGRGLRLIAGMAARWGFFNTDVAKTVWVELTDPTELVEQRPRDPAVPVVVLASRRRPPEGSVMVSFLGVPVRAAVASGAQVDDLVRQIQLNPERLPRQEREAFFRVLERSAAPRLIGRHEAFRAAGHGLDRFSFDVAVSPDEAGATVELTAFLEHLVADGVVQPVAVTAEVVAFRAWLASEFAAQQGGAPPRSYDDAAAGPAAGAG